MAADSGTPVKKSAILSGLLKDPHGTLKLLRNAAFTPAAEYFLVMVVISIIPILLVIGVIALLISAASKTPDILSVLPFIGIFVLLTAGVWLAFTFLVHLVLLVIGRPKRISETFITSFYAITPCALLYWIPLIGIFTPFWALTFMVYGLQDRQDVPQNHAIIAVVISALLIVILSLIMINFSMLLPAGIPVRLNP